MTNMSVYGGNSECKFNARGFFRLERAADRWWLVDPDGHAFVTVGLNHADETNLKYEHNFDIWKRKYGSRRNWIKEGLVKDLKDWGFNTIGWTQEYISGDWGDPHSWLEDPKNVGHSAGWSAADYETADMPYCLQLRVAEIEDWNGQPAFPDVYSQEFDMYCEYLARSICADHADSKNLIGYFLVDIPAWLPEAGGRDFDILKGLDNRERTAKQFEVATKYYETITKHIRRYDANHLILGDRYHGNKGIPTAVLTAMKPFVDVLSVQYFPSSDPEGYQKMRDDLALWQQITDKPVLIADIGNWCHSDTNPNRRSPIKSQAGRADDYMQAIGAIMHEPWFIGWHWCAYVENHARGWGVKDPFDEPYEDFINPVAKFNKAIYAKMTDASGNSRTSAR